MLKSRGSSSRFRDWAKPWNGQVRVDYPLPPTFVFPGSRALDVFLHEIANDSEGGLLLHVAFGRTPTRAYRTSVDSSNPGYLFVSFDEPLFFGLSEWAVRRYANAALYQMELGAIAQAFAAGEGVPDLPARLGTTRFAEVPTLGQLLRNHTKRLLYNWKIRKRDVWVHPDYRPGGQLDPRKPA
jgi:hypothetical protein